MEDPLARQVVRDELYPQWVDDMGRKFWNAHDICCHLCLLAATHYLATPPSPVG